MVLRIKNKPKRTGNKDVKNSAANVCKRSSLRTAGNPDADIILAVDPSIKGSTSEVMAADYLAYLKSGLASAGLRKKDVLFVAVAPPIVYADMQKDRVLGEHIKAYKEDFDKIVAAVNPKLIVASGKSGARQVFGKSVKITTIRGVPQRVEQMGGRVVLPILSPSHVLRVPELKRTFASDMATLGRLKGGGYSLKSAISVVKRDYKYIDDISFILKNPPKHMCADVETTGGQWFDEDSKLLTIQLCFERGVAYNIPLNYSPGGQSMLSPKQRGKLLIQLRQLFENPDIHFFGHNFKYDWLFIKAKLDIEIANYADDTLLLVHAIDENMLNKSLDDCIRCYVPEMSGFNDSLNKDEEHQGKSRMDLLSKPKMLEYGCGDVDSNFRLYEELTSILQKDPKGYNSYRRITMPAIRAFCDVEQVGFTINEAALRKFEKTLAAHQAKEYKRLIKQVPISIRNEFINTGVGLKLNRGDLLRAMLFTHKDGLRLGATVFTKTSTEEKPIPSVSTKQHLPYFAENAFVAGIMDYIKNDKMLNTYVKGFYKYIRGGKVRPSYLLHGTVTGRTASKDPNGQNFPKRGKLAKEYRRIFEAPPGWSLVEADFSQVELRVVAILANEPTMLKVYREGGDIHVNTAAGVMGITVEQFYKLPQAVQDQKRFQAKAINFGFVYGMWWRKFKVYAKTEYGIDYTDREAEQTRTGFFHTYPNLEVYHEVAQAFARKNGYIRSIDGRVRHLPSIFSNDAGVAKQAQRQAINSPVQCFANSLGLLALSRINKDLPKDKINACGFIHDAIVCLVRNDVAKQACQKIKRYMETNPLEEYFGFKSPIPLLADVSLGPNLACMYELSKKWDILMKDKTIKSTDDIFAAIGVAVVPEKPKMRRIRKLRLNK